MTREEAEKIRKGDVLTVKAKVIKDGLDGDGHVSVAGGWFAPEDILSVTLAPREIKVGDLVTWKHRGSFYKVASLFECRAVIDPVESGTLAGIVVLQGDLRHADATEGHAP